MARAPAPRDYRGEALLARHIPRRGCLRPASETANETRLREGSEGFNAGDARAAPTGASADTPQAPGGSHPTPLGTTGPTARTAPAATATVTRAQRGPPAGEGGAESGEEAREGPGPSPPNSPTGPPPTTHGRTGDPQGVFKPPRRNALGTWTAGGGRGGWGPAAGPPTLETP